MANRIDTTFRALRAANQPAFVAYVAAGDPAPDRSLEIMVTLAEAGPELGALLRRLEVEWVESEFALTKEQLLERSGAAS